jgi:Raf kinase inhibitor-like YbhB/YbcL family protein
MMINPFVILLTLAVQSLLTVTSPAFKAGENIPVKYTCEGSNINPPLLIGDLPKGAKSLALILDDPDAPNGTFDHWVMWNISLLSKLEENSAPGKEGKNGMKQNKYIGPCPPSGTHHYHFRIYALDTRLDLPESTDKKALQKAMEGHVLATGELIGLYKKTGAGK